MVDKLAPSDRHKYIHDGRTIYEWYQTLSEVNIYIEVPAGVKAKQLFVDISSTRISLGIRPNPPYLDKDLSERIKVGESFWTLEDGVVHLQLCKAQKGQPWKSAIAGHDINPVQAENEKQRLLLERFQEEHPGFDFSGAKFNGEAPNPRLFMGGMNST